MWWWSIWTHDRQVLIGLLGAVVADSIQGDLNHVGETVELQRHGRPPNVVDSCVRPFCATGQKLGSHLLTYRKTCVGSGHLVLIVDWVQ